jgi:hypothetical protein
VWGALFSAGVRGVRGVPGCEAAAGVANEEGVATVTTEAMRCDADASTPSPASRMAADRLRSGVVVAVNAEAAAADTDFAAGLASACGGGQTLTRQPW